MNPRDLAHAQLFGHETVASCMQRSALRFASTALLAAFTGCGSSGMDANSPLTSGESDSFVRAGGGTLTSQHATHFADGVFDFDPTLDAAASPSMNAQNIGSHLEQNLNGCGMVTVGGMTVTAAFGTAPGCTLKGVTVSGTLTVSVSKSGSTTTVSLDFMSFELNGSMLSGTETFGTTDGTNFSATIDIVYGSRTAKGNLTIAGAMNAFTLNGMLVQTENGIATNLVLTNVHYALNNCYPDSGTVQLTEGLLKGTSTFTAQTANTGVYDVQTGRKTTMKTLPAYGSCPKSS
jgi:hypothetical protein